MKQFDRIRWVNDFVDECKQLGSVKMLVFGSSYGAESDSTILGKEFRMAEKKIEQSGIPHCFLRLGPMIVNISCQKKKSFQCLLTTFSILGHSFGFERCYHR
jgi:uncharacterized protein YbjT (DUF2867 family)